MSTPPLSLGEILQDIADQFEAAELYFGHGTDNAWDEACFLVLQVCGLPLNSDRSAAQYLLSSEQIAKIRAMALRRIHEKIPMPYLLQEAWFAGLKFYVDHRVLVPRSPFGQIIQQQFSPWMDPNHILRVLDLCTGSGCMAIAVAHYLPHVQVDATDISLDALAVAKRNVETHGMQDRIRLIHSDVFDELATQSYDLIISNPPYVDQPDMQDLPDEYQHEPVIGLSSGKDGLDVTKRILRAAKQHLTPNGALMVEVGNSWVALEQQFPQLPFTWIDIADGEDGIFLLEAADLTAFHKNK